MYVIYQDDKRCGEITARTERALMTIGCFFVACRNGPSSHSYRNVQFDHNRGCILDPLLTVVSENDGVIGLCDVIRLAVCDSVLCFLELRSRYAGEDPLFLNTRS